LLRSKQVIEYAALINLSFDVRPWLKQQHNFRLSKQFRLDISDLVLLCLLAKITNF